MEKYTFKKSTDSNIEIKITANSEKEAFEVIDFELFDAEQYYIDTDKEDGNNSN